MDAPEVGRGAAEGGLATSAVAAQERPRPALIRLGYLECAMLGAVARSFSQWGSIVFRPFGRPSLFMPQRPRGPMADHATCEVLSLLAWWLGFVPAVQYSNFQRVDTAVDAALLAGMDFWWTVAKNRRGGHRNMETVLCWHTALALAELAYSVAETGPSGLAIAASNVRVDAGELADWVARWLEHGLYEVGLLHLPRQRYDELMERAAAAARLFARCDSVLRQRAARHWGTRVDLRTQQQEVRAWRDALASVVSWARVCGPPAASIVGVVLGMRPEETLQRLQARLHDSTVRDAGDRAPRGNRLESTLQVSPTQPMPPSQQS